MKPTIGRIVHYSLNGSFFPAMIIAVNQVSVDLTVFGTYGQILAYQSVSFDETRTKGEHWSWPPRES